MSFLRVYASAWIGEPAMVRPLEAYVGADPPSRRSHSADRDRSWDGNAVDFATLLDRVAAVDARVAAQLALLLAFGLRRKEAVMFMPHLAVVDRDQVPGGQHPSERCATFLRLARGTKGGRLRFVAIRNEAQRTAPARALAFAPHASSDLGHPGLSLAQSLKRFDNVLRKVGITRKDLGKEDLACGRSC